MFLSFKFSTYTDKNNTDVKYTLLEKYVYPINADIFLRNLERNRLAKDKTDRSTAIGSEKKLFLFLPIAKISSTITF